jgi:hypothetical protein
MRQIEERQSLRRLRRYRSQEADARWEAAYLVLGRGRERHCCRARKILSWSYLILEPRHQSERASWNYLSTFSSRLDPEMQAEPLVRRIEQTHSQGDLRCMRRQGEQ